MAYGPSTPSEALLTFNFGGVALPNGADTSLGLAADPASWNDPGWQADLLDATRDLVQLTCTNQVNLNSIDIKVGPVATGPTYTVTAGVPGATGTETVPPNTSMLVRKTVAGVSTKLMGRMYWPGTSEGNVLGNGNLSNFANYQTAWTNYFGALVGPLAAVPLVFTAGDPRDVTGLTLQSRVATQRRRLRR